MTELRSEKFEWFGPSPIEPFNLGADGRSHARADDVRADDPRADDARADAARADAGPRWINNNARADAFA